MQPREERWYGSKGVYFPGTGEHWFPHKGISRAVVQEGQLNFSSTEDAMIWLSKTPGFVRRIYRNDGLCVWYSLFPARNQLSCDVFQIYINGTKPSNLPGAEDSKIAVSPLEGIPESTKAPLISPEDSNKVLGSTMAPSETGFTRLQKMV